MKRYLHAIALLLLAMRAWADPAELERWNCTACHAASEKQAAWILPIAAPRLGDTGSRINPECLRGFLASPHETFPGTAMPDLLHGDAEKVDALTHYLVSLGQAKYRRVMPDKAAVARG